MFLNESETMVSLTYLKDAITKAVTEVFHKKEMNRKNYQKVEIKSCEDSPVFSEIFIGGQKIDGVRSWELTQKAGDIPRLHLDISAVDLAVDGRFVCTAEGWGDFAMRMIQPDSPEMEKESE